MSWSKTFSASMLSAWVSFTLVTASSCGTKAVGVEDCRTIEQARCRAGVPCGLVDDAEACERYYRDHCLHGLASKLPAGASVGNCAQSIKAAGRCAETDPEISLVDCTEEGIPSPRSQLTRACDVVAHPERASECSFLLEAPDEGGSGGQPATPAGGAGGSDEPSAGAGGQAEPP